MQLLQNPTELKGGPKMVPFGYLGKLCLHIDIYLLTFYFEIKKKKLSICPTGQSLSVLNYYA